MAQLSLSMERYITHLSKESSVGLILKRFVKLFGRIATMHWTQKLVFGVFSDIGATCYS